MTTVLAIEEWRPLAERTDYEVSSLGAVRHGACVLKSWEHKSGHLYVTVHGVGKRQVHRLVLQAFHGDQPLGHESCHRDGDPKNNASSNLYWGTRSANMEDLRVHTGRYPKSKVTFTEAEAIRLSYTGQRGDKRRIAAARGLSESLVGRIINGRTYRRAS